jgi:predicted small metal-binding protein
MSKPRKVLECGAVVPGCNFVAHAESEDELMIIAAEHARAVHGIDHMSDELRAKVRAVITDA